MDARIRSTSPMSSRSPLGVSRRRFLAVGLGLSALSVLVMVYTIVAAPKVRAMA